MSVDRFNSSLADRIIYLYYSQLFSEKLVGQIEEFVSSEVVNELSTITNFAELKNAITIAQKLRETISAVETTSDSESLSATNLEVSTNQAKLALDLKNAVSVLHETGVENIQELAPALNKGALEKINEVVNNLRSDLDVVINIHLEIKEAQESQISDKQEKEESIKSKDEQLDSNKSKEKLQDTVNQSTDEDDTKKTTDNIEQLPSALSEYVTPKNETSVSIPEIENIAEEVKLDSAKKSEPPLQEKETVSTEQTKEIVEVISSPDTQSIDKPKTEAILTESLQNIAAESSEALVDSDVKSLSAELHEETATVKQVAADQQNAVEITQTAPFEPTENIEEKSAESVVSSTSEQQPMSEAIIKSTETVESQPKQEELVSKETIAISEKRDQCQEKLTDAADGTTSIAGSAIKQSETTNISIGKFFYLNVIILCIHLYLTLRL